MTYDIVVVYYIVQILIRPRTLTHATTHATTHAHTQRGGKEIGDTRNSN